MHKWNAWRANTSAMMYEAKCFAQQINKPVSISNWECISQTRIALFYLNSHSCLFFFIYSYNFSNRFSTSRNVPLISHAHTLFQWNDETWTNHKSTKTTYWNGNGHLWEESWQSNFINCKHIPKKRFFSLKLPIKHRERGEVDSISKWILIEMFTKKNDWLKQ